MTSTATTVSAPTTTTASQPASSTSSSTPVQQPLWRRVLAAVGVALLMTFGGGTEALAAANGEITNTTFTPVSDTDRTGSSTS